MTNHSTLHILRRTRGPSYGASNFHTNTWSQPFLEYKIERFAEEVSRAHREKSQWEESNDSSNVLRQTAGNGRIHSIQAH